MGRFILRGNSKAMLQLTSLFAAGSLACLGGLLGARPPATGGLAPAFPSQSAEAWVGPPQSLKALRGKVVLLDVWTFG